jgi:glycosyltransferase involved in cell wall biosynthesis
MIVVLLTSSRFVGSVERQMLGLASALPDAYQCVFVSFSEGGRCQDFLEEAKQQGFAALSLRHDTPRLLAASIEITSLLQQLKPAILCCHGYKTNLLGRLASRRLGIPCVAVCHGWTGENAKVKLYESMDRLVLRTMDRVVCVSEAQAGTVRRAGVPASRLSVIRDAVRPERFGEPNASYAELVRRFFPRQVTRFVAAAGRLSPEKGFADLVAAASVVARSDPSVGFVLFGDGPLRATLSRQIAEYGLQRVFHLAGFHADLDRYLPYFDLTVLPSFTEGLPNIVLESFAAGVPVVATAVGGTPEVVQDGINGYLVKHGHPEQLAERILHALRSKQRGHRMGLAGKERVLNEFSFKVQAQTYQSLFKNLAWRPRIKARSVISLGAGKQNAKLRKQRWPIRVCFLIDRLGTAGTETQLLNLIRGLDRSRVLPHLGLLDGCDSQSRALAPADCPTIRLGVRSLHHPRTALMAVRFARFLRRQQISVLQLYFPDSTYFGALVGRLAGIPCVVGTRFDLGYWMTPVHRFLGRLCSHLLDRTIVNSEACCRAVMADLRRLPHPVTVLENGVDLSAFDHTEIKPRAGSDPRIGMVANLRAVKNPELFIRAASLLRAANANLEFAVAGEGELRPQLQQLIEQLGLRDHCRLVGRVNDIPAFLATLDVAVLCSWSEGLPNAVLEYMAAGRPIVATAVGGSLELIENGVHGLTVPPGDAAALASAIDRLIKSPELAARLGAAARQRVCERYSQHNRLRRFEEFYESVIHGEIRAARRTDPEGKYNQPVGGLLSCQFSSSTNDCSGAQSMQSNFQIA